MAGGFNLGDLAETLSNTVNSIFGTTIPGTVGRFGDTGQGPRGTFTAPRTPTPLTPVEKDQYFQKYELQKELQHPKLDNRMVPINVARVSGDFDDVDFTVDDPPPPPPPPAPVTNPFGFTLGTVTNAQGVSFGQQGPFGFTPDHPVFGWTDTSQFGINDPNSTPVGGPGGHGDVTTGPNTGPTGTPGGGGVGAPGGPGQSPPGADEGLSTQ